MRNKTKTSTFLVTVQHDAGIRPTFIRQNIKGDLLDMEEIKSVKINNAALESSIKALAESIRHLRMLRQYASHIRNQVMLHLPALKKTEITYIDLDTLDEVSVTMMLNREALRALGVPKVIVDNYLRRKS